MQASCTQFDTFSQGGNAMSGVPLPAEVHPARGVYCSMMHIRCHPFAGATPFHHELQLFAAACSCASSAYFCALTGRKEVSSGFKSLRYLAGLPPQSWPEGTSAPSTTTDPAATIAPLLTCGFAGGSSLHDNPNHMLTVHQSANSNLRSSVHPFFSSGPFYPFVLTEVHSTLEPCKAIARENWLSQAYW